jgi:hypothetical protein
MIASAQRNCSVPSWHETFLALVPSIVRHASHAFRRHPAKHREDAVQEVVANCLVAFVRLHELGKGDLVYPSVLARYAVKQYRAGRRVGTKTNTRDITSPAARRKHRHIVERLDHLKEDGSGWKECLVEDRSAGPAATAMARIDYADWLRTLTPRNRRVANTLAEGESTSEASKRFGISAGRISQIRRELFDNWRAFQGEPAAA